MARKDEAAELATKLVQVLDAQRRLGAEAYPPTLRRLIELTDPQANEPLIKKAISKPAFRERAIVVSKDPNAPVGLREDLEQILSSPAVVLFALEKTCTAAKPTVPVKTVTGKIDKSLQAAFQQSLTQQMADKCLPPGVGAVQVKNQVQLHLLRWPLPRKPEEQLAEVILQALETRRERGDAAYPVKLGDVIDSLPQRPSPPLLKKALATKLLKQRLLVLWKDEQTLLAFQADQERVLTSQPVLLTLLGMLRSATSEAFPVSKLKSKLPANLKLPFEQAMERRTSAGALPEGIGWLWWNNARLFFRVADIHARHAPATQAPKAERPPPDFALAFDSAFQEINRQGGSHNFVSLTRLRPALPWPRESFDAGLRELRRAGRYSLSAVEGRHGITPEERDAGIVEDGTLLLYVSRKHDS